MLAELKDGEIWITSSYAERHLIQQLPGVRFDRKAEQWHVPVTWVTCLTMRALFGTALRLGPALKAWALPEKYDEQHLQDLSVAMDAPQKGHDKRLFNYQRAGADFLFFNQRGLLGDEPGLGKTAQVIAAVKAMSDAGMKVFPLLVVCPNSLKRTWQDEFATWWPGTAVQVVDGSAPARRRQLASTSASVHAVNWESVRLHSSVSAYGSIRLKACAKCGGLKNPREDEQHKGAVPEAQCEKHPRELNLHGYKTVIVDEAHRMKDPNAKQTRAVWSVLHGADYRFCLTGTPIADNVGDLWSLLHGIDPAAFPVRSKFLDAFATTQLNFFGGYEVLGLKPERSDVFHRILDLYMRRVPKELALPQLPPKLPPVYRRVKMRPAQAKQYKQMRDGMLTLLSDGTPLSADSNITQMTRLRQFACATGACENGSVRLADPSCKVDDLLEYLEDNPKPLVVAAVSSQLIMLAAKRISKDTKLKYGLITGKQTIDERHAAMKAFQDGKTDLILMTIGAGGEGLTLTRADTMYFMERSYSLLANKQAEDRVYRIGSERHSSVSVVTCITEGTIEDSRELLLSVKEDRFEEVVRDRDRMKRILSGE